MANPQIKSLRSPDDIVRLEGMEEWSVQVGEQTIGRAILQPGWRWSTHLKPVVGTRSCAVRHVGLVVSGRFAVQMDDGRQFELGPDDVFDVPPGHDSWVVGDVPFETVEIAGIFGYGRPIASGESFVASVLFIDLVDSTATLERLGELQFRRLLDRYFEGARRELDRWRGVEIATTGDGLLATFDSAARAIRCAAGMHGSAGRLGVRIRVGIHTGEIESVPGNIRGLAVHVAARLAAFADPGETLVSSTTREMVSAADVSFQDRGAHRLKGITGARRLFAAIVTEEVVPG